MSESIFFNPIYLETNHGHGYARRVSLNACSFNYVALMDADDISLNYRFQKQLDRFINNKELSIVGGQISEFSENENNIIGIRKVPQAHNDIVEYAKKRCPMNQVSVMFKKDAVESAGGYIDWYCEEDYYLWLRMIEKGFIFENVPDILVNVRAGDQMSSRRGGLHYFISEAKLQKYMYKTGMISKIQYLFNVAIRFGGEVILTNKLRLFAFKLLRTSPTNYSINGKTIVPIQKGCIYPKFSVAICVYRNDNPEWFDYALDSIIVKQTIKPSEVVLVVDGPVPTEIDMIINKYAAICKNE